MKNTLLCNVSKKLFLDFTPTRSIILVKMSAKRCLKVKLSLVFPKCFSETKSIKKLVNLGETITFSSKNSKKSVSFICFETFWDASKKLSCPDFDHFGHTRIVISETFWDALEKLSCPDFGHFGHTRIVLFETEAPQNVSERTILVCPK